MPDSQKSVLTVAASGLDSYSVFEDDLSRIDLQHRKIIHALNPHSYCMAENDPLFKAALRSADILLPDGIGIVWATRFLHGKNLRRICGMDVFEHLLITAATRTDPAKRRVFFLGTSPSTLEKIQQRIREEFPTLVVGSCAPPFREVFSNQEREIMMETIRRFDPHILFVGMTAPKQEKWAYEHQREIPQTTICCIGAAFDYYAGTVKRPGAFWRERGLEWLIRFLREPRRLWRRTLVSGPLFVLQMLLSKLKL